MLKIGILAQSAVSTEDVQTHHEDSGLCIETGCWQKKIYEIYLYIYKLY